MNTFNITGRASQDVPLYKTQTGKEFARLNIAVRKDFKNANGEYDTDFIDVGLWNQNATYANKYINKGDIVSAKGHICVSKTYNDRIGRNEYKIELVADKVEINAKFKENGQNNVSNSESASVPEPIQASDPYADFANEVVITDDDLPF